MEAFPACFSTRGVRLAQLEDRDPHPLNDFAIGDWDGWEPMPPSNDNVDGLCLAQKLRWTNKIDIAICAISGRRDKLENNYFFHGKGLKRTFKKDQLRVRSHVALCRGDLANDGKVNLLIKDTFPATDQMAKSPVDTGGPRCVFN